MASKTILLLVLAFATVLLITSHIVAATDLTSDHDTSEVEDSKYHVDHDNGGYYNGGGRGGYYNGGGRGGYYNGGGHHGGGGYCRHGCCGRYYNGGCRCCRTNEEATAYKQAHDAQTHN